MARRKPVSRTTPRWWRRLGLALRYGVIGAIWGAIALGLVLLYFTWDMPDPAHAVTAPRRPAIRLYDQSGHLVARFGDVAGRVVLPRELPAYVPGAFIAIEDRRFYQHGAFDLQGIARAALLDVGRGRIVQGGSTLTQQVAKTLFLTDQRSLRRKVQEAILSLWLARHYTKQEILGIYLNRVYLGEGAYGVDAAARLYFGVPATALTLAQAAILAGLPQAPSSLNPLADPRAAAERARDVLNAMVATQRISLAAENTAEQQLNQAAAPSMRDSWFALWVMQRDSGLIPGGQDVSLTTTLDPRLQHVAEAALDAAIAAHGAALRISQGAVVVLDARTGAVRALVGGVGDRDGYDRAVLARRQTGSAIKPIVWLAGLRAGMSPDDQVLDAPLYFRGYDPRDDERVYHGEVTMTEALADSMNTVAIRILLRAGGPRRVIALARTLGLNDHFPDDVTMALGTGGVGVMQLAGAYAAFFNGGNRVTPYGVTAVNGVPYAAPPPVPVVPPEQAGEVAAMMRAVVLNGTATGAFVPGLYTAGKTGTTQDYRDAWFVGDAGPDIIAVWVGNDNNAPMKKVYGGTVPASVFKAIAVSLAQ
ncbi:MAG TPA: transglycosylase domain-containing protein [Acidocella sp.]|jgi:penicillin-binding protein 1A|nr:transglycosylase domain-containing protein [Acidocella sp.]